MNIPNPLPSAQTAGRLAAAGIFFFAGSAAWAHHVNKRFTVQPHPLITVSNSSGTVTVKAWDRQEVQVIADHASDKMEVDATQIGNRVDLLAHPVIEGVTPDDLRTDYEITVPADAELQIRNDAGSVLVANIFGDMAVDTVAAGVDMSDTAGYVTVKTVGGSFTCRRCAGRIEVTSISGNVKLLDARSYKVRAQTSTGNVLFDGEFLPNGIYQLRNYSGTVEVRFSPDDSFDLSATSLHGKVNNDANLTPPSHQQHRIPRMARGLFGSINQGRAKVELSSFDGTINIHRRE